jgi:hypothetical protein
MENKIQVRLPNVLMAHVEIRSSGMDFTPSAFVRYLIIKDKESTGDEKSFWKDAVDTQIIEMKARIEELQKMKEDLDNPD